MSEINTVFPNIDKITEWFLQETIYCLQHYAHMNEESAYQTLRSNDHFQFLVIKYPGEIQRETGYYWAMYLLHGTNWWRESKHLVDQHSEYIKVRHSPPMDDDEVEHS